MPNRFLACVLMLSISLAIPVTQAGPKWEVGDDAFIQLGMLGQVHASYTEDAVDEHDIYLRRARLILSGQVLDGVKFFMETDNDNAGRSGTTGISTDIQDAFVEQRLHENHFVQGGLLLLPFSFENASSAGSILGLDYNLDALKFAETFAWRDYGVLFRGDFNKRVAYRVGVFDGYDDKAGAKNPDAPLRGTGHLAVNLIGETENGWFFTQDRLADAPYLTLGVGADHQDEATLGTATNTPSETIDNQALVVDFQSGCPLGPIFATINGAWFTWDNATFDGDTAFIETGLRHKDKQVTCKLNTQNPADGATITDTTVGVHHFRKQHKARAGLEYRWGDSDQQVLLGFQVAL